MPFDLSNDIELVVHCAKQTRIWLDFVNGRSVGAKSERSVGLVYNPSLLVGDDGVADVFRGKSESSSHGCPHLAETLHRHTRLYVD